MPDLIRLVHKNSMGLTRLMKTFREYWGAKVTASNNHCGSDDPMGMRERSTSPSDDPSKATSTENSPFCKPKTPGAAGGGTVSELENASGISKRQLERKIQSMAIKEARPPNHKQLWYVHDSVLQKYGIDGNALSPLQVASPSVVAKGGENGTSVNSPQTPCGSGAAAMNSRKRKPLAKGMKSLFDFVNSASSTATASSSGAGGGGGGEGQPPSLKKSRIEIVDDPEVVMSSKPLATPTSSNVQVLPTSRSPKNSMEPPLKKARLDLTVESPKKLKSSADEEVIVIVDCENSNNKDKGVAVEKGATPISPNLVDITNTTSATAPLSMSIAPLNASTTVTTTAAPTISQLAKLIQQCTNASRR